MRDKILHILRILYRLFTDSSSSLSIHILIYSKTCSKYIVRLGCCGINSNLGSQRSQYNRHGTIFFPTVNYTDHKAWEGLHIKKLSYTLTRLTKHANSLLIARCKIVGGLGSLAYFLSLEMFSGIIHYITIN